MKEYILFFRMNITQKSAQPTKSQMKIYMEQWMQWIQQIASAGQLAEGGNHLSKEGRVLKSDKSVIHSPYVAYHNSIAGFIIVRAKNLNDASKLAALCPILQGKNTSVEIREVAIAGN